ncbi:MAG: Flp pilus assembly complex ATPase component TadA [Gemmatimonadetes bacterium]|nr:Flp pilus assembly complex ATPase component TadA [Gemmatimonadota bacterium]
MKTAKLYEHWLVRVALDARLDRAETADLPAGTHAAEAWELVGRVCGVSEDELARKVAAAFRLKLADLSEAEPRALKLVPERLARRFQIFPLRESDRHIVVATCDPTDVEVEQAVGFASGRRLVFEVAPPGALKRAISSAYSPEQALDNLLTSVGAEAGDSVRVVEEMGPEEIGTDELEQAPVVRLTNVILRDAIRERASDIHIEPGYDGAAVRFRVDGVLRRYMRMPMHAVNRVVSRIKILGQLDIADRFRPQDGRVRIQVDGRNYDLRISTVPTQEAEKAVIRVLDPKGARRLDDVGLPAPELARIRTLLSFREGIMVVTGPTGSGKTTTLYGALTELATGEVNVMTVEDPVEYQLPGITQIQVEPKRGLTFASALRAILRQDPDVIFVGEIRDLETAEVAAQASMTGHVVLATLHTNDAVGVVSRLADLGLDHATIAASLRGCLGQRLVRRVCPHCAEPVSGPLTEQETRLARRYGVKPAVRAAGCKRCDMTGYRGRIPLAEVVTVTREFAELIARGGTAAELERAAIAGGMRPLHRVAADPIAAGLTTLQEADRVLGEVGEAEEAEASPVSFEPHILVVDDDAEIRLLARTLLERDGLRVSEAADGAAALDLMSAGEDYSLVVLDLNMPGLDGRQVLARLRGSLTTAGLPVVVLTGLGDAETEVELMEQGADDYLRKPIEPARFLARVKAALRRAAV